MSKFACFMKVKPTKRISYIFNDLKSGHEKINHYLSIDRDIF
jgi:hypothetical protein